MNKDKVCAVIHQHTNRISIVYNARSKKQLMDLLYQVSGIPDVIYIDIDIRF